MSSRPIFFRPGCGSQPECFAPFYPSASSPSVRSSLLPSILIADYFLPGVLVVAQEVEEEQRHHIVIPWTPPPPHPPYDQHSLTTLPNPLNHPTILSSLSLTHLGGGGRGSCSCPRRAKPRIISFQPIFSCPKPNPWVSNCSVAQFGKAHTLIWPSEKADRFRVQAKAKPSSLELFTSFSQISLSATVRQLLKGSWEQKETLMVIFSGASLGGYAQCYLHIRLHWPTYRILCWPRVWLHGKILFHVFYIKF